MNPIYEKNNDHKLVYDYEKLLSLLQNISENITNDSIKLQSQINMYLKELLQVEYVLIVPLLPASDETQTLSEGLIQVVNDKILDKEFRFSVNISDVGNLSHEVNSSLFKVTDLNKSLSEVIEMASKDYSLNNVLNNFSDRFSETIYIPTAEWGHLCSVS
ncbi:hypothetical protein PVAND_006634 [Polypedilum vanderplanki]|uniref:Uncharacterized protein n=1 Tax=Polypedilum vanderplanki TaxID=319348 RepID=A0A9J6C4T3_POLVA|nr:hypothetical protein PVAND_006634 [Polypedilum vanderplanki]